MAKEDAAYDIQNEFRHTLRLPEKLNQRSEEGERQKNKNNLFRRGRRFRH